MKTETEKELRELDAWIAEHVMGYRWFAYEGGKSNRFCDLQIPSDWQARHGGIQCESSLEGYERDIGGVPKYTTNPADAMAVLEKCCAETMQEDCVYIGKTESEWIVGHTTRNFEEVADTLPMAICLFAKQLFSK